MSGMAPPVRILERLTLPAPFGIIFWDFATGARIGDGLDVTLTQVSRPALTTTLIANRVGVWIAPKLPGRADWELAATADWTTLERTYRIAVADRFGRFLPLTIEAELPARGLYEWPHWSGLPQAPLAPLIEPRSPPELDPTRIPLFSAPERKVAGPLAEVRCQLADLATGAAAPWALVTASCDDEHHVRVTRGIGLADKMGRATLFFAYPERPRPQLLSPPVITDFRWDIDIAAYYVPPPGPAPDAPDLAAIMAQLAHPCDLLASTSSPPHLLGAQSLSFGRPLVLRTDNPPDGPSSSLFLDQRP